MSPSSDETIKRRRANKGATIHSQYQRTVLFPPLTPGASSNTEGDCEVSKLKNRRKQRQEEKKSSVRTRAKPDAILVKS